jgi:hypothetical protein
MLGRIGNAIVAALTGVKTLAFAAVVFLVSLGEYLDVIELRPVLEHFLGEDRAGLIVVLIPVVFAGLRFLTSTPVIQKVRDTLKGGIDNPEGDL